jgi:hypothetical protein
MRSKRKASRRFRIVPHCRRSRVLSSFDKAPERSAGVWVVRQGALRFALPITTGPKPGMSDYLPSRRTDLPGFAAPVEQIYPALTPYVDLNDGRTVVATDGADAIEPAADGRCCAFVGPSGPWSARRQAKVQDVGLTSEVVWRIENGTLIREETLSSKQPVTFVAGGWLCRRLTKGETEWLRVCESIDSDSNEGIARSENFADANFPDQTSILATGNSRSGAVCMVRFRCTSCLSAGLMWAWCKPLKPLALHLALTVTGFTRINVTEKG